MVAFNFKPEFAPLILSGQKVQTVRMTRRARAGDAMHLYTGLRTKKCELIAKRVCALSDYCNFNPGGVTFGNAALHPDADTFAQWDGFTDYKDMHAWFMRQYGTPYFVGFVHRWKAE